MNLRPPSQSTFCSTIFYTPCNLSLFITIPLFRLFLYLSYVSSYFKISFIDVFRSDFENLFVDFPHSGTRCTHRPVSCKTRTLTVHVYRTPFSDRPLESFRHTDFVFLLCTTFSSSLSLNPIFIVPRSSKFRNIQYVSRNRK